MLGCNHFYNASELGYGQCSYIKMVNKIEFIAACYWENLISMQSVVFEQKFMKKVQSTPVYIKNKKEGGGYIKVSKGTLHFKYVSKEKT